MFYGFDAQQHFSSSSYSHLVSACSATSIAFLLPIKAFVPCQIQPGLTTNCPLLPIGDLTTLANSRLFSSSERVSMIVYIFGRTSRDTASGFASYDDPNVVPACAQSLLCLLLDTTFIIVTLNIGGSHVRHNINKVLL